MLMRALLACSLLLWALWAERLSTISLFLAINCFLLYWRGAKFVLLWRSFRLLMWLFVPMIIFHGIFTPGVFVQSPIYLPLTLEGLSRALLLCVHVLLIFFAALSCFRLLHTAEWVHLIQRVPWLGHYCLPYLLLIPALRSLAMDTLAQQQLAWQEAPLSLCKKWQTFPDFLVQSLSMMLVASKKEAYALWANWAQRIQAIQSPVSYLNGLAGDMFYGLCLMLGWGILWLSL